jgi:hypothetical protein
MEGDMRKLILISAMLLMSATAYASGQRSLILASSDEPAKSVETKPADAAAAETPKYVERPSVVDTNAAQPAAQCQPSPTTAEPPKMPARDIATTEKPRHRHQSTQSRVISELHRYGIYW